MGTSRILLVAMAVAASAFAQAPTPKHPFSAEYVYTANGQPMAGMPPIKTVATPGPTIVPP